MPYPSVMADEAQVRLTAEVHASLDALTRAYLEAVDALDAIAEPEQRFAAATRVAARLQELTETAATYRARTAHRIRVTESLSYSKLGIRLGISKARAEQLARAGERADHRHPDLP